MRNQEGPQADGESEAATSIPTSELDDWANFGDDDIMHQQSAIRAEEVEKTLFLADKVKATITF
jgi:hypothetical protein